MTTLDQLALKDVDQGAQQLAIRLAQQLDDAAWTERAADRVLKLVEAGEFTGEEIDAVRALRSKLSARVAVSDLAPKLAGLLDALGATPMARAKMTKLAPSRAATASAGASKLASLKGALGA